MITTVTGKNQVTVPVAIAVREGIHSGTQLDWQSADQEHTLLVRVLPDRRELAKSLRGRGKKHLKGGSDPVQNLLREREREEKEPRET